MNRTKHQASIFLCLLSIILIFFTGCGKDSENSLRQQEESITWIDNQTPSSNYVANIFQPKDLSAYYISKILPAGENLYIITLKNSYKDGVTTPTAFVYETDYTGKPVQSIDCYGKTGDFQSSPSGELWLMVKEETADKSGINYMIYSLHSNEPQCIIIDSFYGGAINWKVDNSCIYILKAFIDKEGCSLSILSRDGTPIYEYDYQEQLFLFPSETELYCSTWENDHLYVLNKTSGELRIVADINDRIVQCIKDGKVFLSDEAGVYSIDLSTKEERTLFNWSSFGILRCDNLLALENEQFLVYSMLNQTTPYRLITQCDRPAIEKKNVIFAINDPDPFSENSVYSNYSAIINDFNSTSPYYHVIVKNYGQCQNPQSILNTEIISGNGPDLIELTSFSSELLNSDDCEDLLPFISNDPTIDENDFLPAPLELMKKDGRLLSLIPSFYIDSLVCNANTLPKSEIHTYYDLCPHSSNFDQILYGSLSRDTVLELAFAQESRNYSLEEIHSIVELYTALPECGVSTPDNIAAGKQLYDFCRIGTPLRSSGQSKQTTGLAEKHLLFGKNIVFPGLQVSGGFSPIIEPVQELVMLRNANEKEGVWSFMRFMLSDNYLIKSNSYGEYRYGIPIMKSAYRAGLDGMKNWIDVYQTLRANGVGQDYQFSDYSDVALFEDLTNRVGGIIRDKDELLLMVKAISADCLIGKKNAQQVAEDIYGRIAIYQAEHN